MSTRTKDNNSMFVDIASLRDHISTLQEEKKIALRLYESVLITKNASEPEFQYQYDRILYNINQMIRYFDKMVETFEYIGEEAWRLSYELKGIIEKETENVRDITSRTFML